MLPVCFALTNQVTVGYDSRGVNIPMVMLPSSVRLMHGHATSTTAPPFPPLAACVRVHLALVTVQPLNAGFQHVSDFIFCFLCKQTKDESFHFRRGVNRRMRISLLLFLSLFPLNLWHKRFSKHLPFVLLHFYLCFVSLFYVMRSTQIPVLSGNCIHTRWISSQLADGVNLLSIIVLFSALAEIKRKT